MMLNAKRETWRGAAIILLCFLMAAGFEAFAHATAAHAAGKDKPAAARDAAVKRDALSAEDVVPPGVKTQEDYFTDEGRPPERPVGVVSVGRVFFSLLVAIGLILLLAHLMRTVWARNVRLDVRGKHMRVLDVLQLGLNRTVYLLQVGNRAIVLGTSDKGLQYLTEITDPADVEALLGEAEDAAPQADGGFAAHLAGALGANRGAARTLPFAERFKEKLSKLNPDSPDEPKGPER